LPLLLLLLLFVAGRCLVPMDETDLFFNLRLGEIILSTHRVPLTNLLSFTYADYPDANLAWLFQIVLALAHRWGGVPGTVVLKTAFVLATVCLLWRVGRRRGAHPTWLAAVLALAVWAAEPRFVERPHLVTFLGLALTMLALERAERQRPRLLLALIPAGFIWANANSCFFLAPVVLLLYAAGALADRRRTDARRAALVAAALLPIILATPSGTGALGYIANHFRMPNLRPLQEYRVATWPLDGPFFFLAAAVVVAMVVAGRGRWRMFLPVLALGLLGARRIRFVAEFALLAAPAVAAALTEATAGLSKPRVAPFAAGAVAAALAILTVAPRVADAGARPGQTASTLGLGLDLGVESDLVPTEAIRFAEGHGLRERMYNDLEVGSYLTWDGWPRFRVFQDPRINGYPPGFHALLRRADLSRAQWQALLDRFDVTAALITYPAVNPRAALFDPALWALVYRTDQALVFARRQPARAALLAAEELPVTFRYDAASGLTPVALPDRPAGAPMGDCAWNVRLGDFFLEDAQSAAARASYRAATGCLDAGRRSTLGALELQLGDPAAAVRLLEPTTDPASRTPASQVRRGYALLGLHRAAEALEAFDQALRAAPDRDLAQPDTQLAGDVLLGRGLALQALHRDPEAISALQALLRQVPDHVAAAEARSRIARLSAAAAAAR
jgi:tetratricopeptide (TPR) repeat protein